VRKAEPKQMEKTTYFEIRFSEINESGETTNIVVFTENSNFSSPYSLKLKIQATYSITLSMDANLTLKYLKLKDQRFRLSEDGWENSGDGKKVYKFVWNTNDVPKTKNSKRFILSSTMKIEGYKKFQFDMLVKFYREGERRVYDGMELAGVGLEFLVPKDPESPSYDPEDDDSDSEEDSTTKFHVINDMTFMEAE